MTELTKAQWRALRSLSRAPRGVLWGGSNPQSSSNLNGTTAGHLARKGMIRLADDQKGKAKAYVLTTAGKALLEAP